MIKHEETWQERKNRQAQWEAEHTAGGFTCAHCGRWVPIHKHMGTVNRNHCSVCLWSKHVDEDKGDRRAVCLGEMKPIGLTFKYEGAGRQGEMMLVHECMTCAKVSINRIASDDDNDALMNLFTDTAENVEARERLQPHHIRLLSPEDRPEVTAQLFGK
jgi:hypothetical protein